MPKPTIHAAGGIEMRDPATLKPHPENPRDHSDPAAVWAFRQTVDSPLGWTRPIFVNPKGTILVGHGAQLAALLDKDPAGNPIAPWPKVPVVVVRGLNKDQELALMVADNRHGETSTWNMDALRPLLERLGVKFDMAALGFSPVVLPQFLARPNTGFADPDAQAPEPKEAPAVREGDLWLLGGHRLLCGDATSKAAVDLLLEGAKPNLMVTDPPYGVEYDPAWRTRAGVGGAGTAVGKVLNDDRADWSDAWRLFPGNVAYVWHGGLHGVTVDRSLIDCGFQMRAQIIWVKARAAMSRGNYHWQHEPMFYAQKPGTEDGWRFGEDHEAAGYVVRVGATAGWAGGRKQTTVWFIDHVKNDTGHGTQKPVECMKRPMENNSKLGDAVYDPFLGSSTSIIAAEMSGRHCYGLELSPAYAQVGIERWEAFTNQKATLNGKTLEEVTAARKKGRARG